MIIEIFSKQVVSIDGDDEDFDMGSVYTED